MPADMSKYPANWPEIRNRILRRAGGSEDDPRIGARCEWCQIENYAIRDGSKIVLTIAHVHDMDPANVANDNLAALCQRCHNRHDVKHRKQNRAMTRRGRKIAAGQMVLQVGV